MQRTLAELKQECLDRDIGVSMVKKYGKKELIDLLQDYTLRGMEHVSWGLRKRLEIESPMLCFGYKHLKPEQQRECMYSEKWLAEEKCDGVRMIATYHPEEGFKFFSRNLSVKDFLPVEYTDKILLWHKLRDRSYLGGEFKGVFKKSFILDCEFTCLNPNIDTTLVRGKYGTETETVLNAVTSILSIEAVDSIKIQREQDAALNFQVFDILEIDELFLYPKPLEFRIGVRNKTVYKMREKKSIEVSVVKGTIKNKQEFYDQIVAEGGEGIVLKNLDSSYIPTTSRKRDGFVKRKRSMEEAVGADIDAFITGFVPANPKKSWAHLIGAIKLSVFVPCETDKDTARVHQIAAVASMPLQMREAMTITGPDGKPQLNVEYLTKVLTINGQDIAPKSLRFMHATADWKRGFREDKSYLDCEMTSEVLKAMVL